MLGKKVEKHQLSPIYLTIKSLPDMILFKRTRQKIFKRSIGLVEWVVHTPKTVLWHFSPYGAYLKNGALLRVRKDQVAVLVSDGKFADMYQQGEYKLTASNMPILTTMKGWKRGFNSPFKIDVYFVCTKNFTDMPWVTKEPVLMNDKEFGPIHIYAFGTFCFRVHHNPIVFIRNVRGTDGYFTTNSIIEELRKFVVEKFADYLSESNIAAFDLSTDLKEFSNQFRIAMKNDFLKYGIELSSFLVESITLPEVVQAALYKKTSKQTIGNMTTYTEMKINDTLKSDTKN